MLQKIIVFLIPLVIIISAFFYYDNLNSFVPDDNAIPQTPAEYIRTLNPESIVLNQYDYANIKTMKGQIVTNKGNINFILFPDYAPIAVENFVSLANQGYYNGLLVTAALGEVFIQSGDPFDGTGGTSTWGKPFKTETHQNLWNFNGAMGYCADFLNDNRSQFYIIGADRKTFTEDMLSSMEKANFPKKVMEKYKDVGGAPWLDGKYTIFGQVTDGFYVINEIMKSQNENPDEKIIIQEIVIEMEKE